MEQNRTPRSRANIRMVAERAGFSPTTVSLALRGDGSIPLETRERVLEAARELNYVHISRAPQPTQQIRRFAFVAPDFGDHPVSANPFYGEVLGGVEQECALHGARLTFITTPAVLSSELQRPPSLDTGELDALLLVGAYPAPIVELLAAEADRPCVLVDNFIPGQPYDSVMADDFSGGFMATRHLLELGHRSIAMIAGMMAIPSFAERYRGYHVACTAAGVTPQKPIEVEYGIRPLAALLDELFGQSEPPTAFFCVGDAYAASIMDLARDLGYKVPDNLSVVGFDNLAPMRLVRPALTTINNNPRALGRIAVQRLMARLKGDRLPAQRISVGVDLIVRESTRRIEVPSS